MTEIAPGWSRPAIRVQPPVRQPNADTLTPAEAAGVNIAARLEPGVLAELRDWLDNQAV